MARVVYLAVALADNASQGIAKVPAKIGNGDDPVNNLYWGCDDGLRSYFSKSARWKRVVIQSATTGPVLERCVFQHRSRGVVLVADAYRGSEIRRATSDFLSVASGAFPAIPGHGTVALAAFIGHNGLMDFSLPAPTPIRPLAGKPAVVLCCASDQYFRPLLTPCGSQLLLSTRQLMYPGSFLLHDALEGWLAGENRTAIRARAGRAYARNQKISQRAALGVFAP